MKWFVVEKPISPVRIVRVSKPENFKSCRNLGFPYAHLLNANSLLQCINGDMGRGRVDVGQVLTHGDAHAPQLHEEEGHKSVGGCSSG